MHRARCRRLRHSSIAVAVGHAAGNTDGNAWHGDVISIGCRNSYAHGERLIAMVGLEDIVVVDTTELGARTGFTANSTSRAFDLRLSA